MNDNNSMSISQKQTAVSKLKLTDDGEVIHQSLSSQNRAQDTINLPEGAFVFDELARINCIQKMSISNDYTNNNSALETPAKPFESNQDPDCHKMAEEQPDMEVRDIQIISLETTTRGTPSNLKKSFIATETQAKNKQITQTKVQVKHADGKKSVGLKSSILKKRINQKAMSAKTSVKKINIKSQGVGKMSVKYNAKKEDLLTSLAFNLKNKSIPVNNQGNKSRGFVTPCKPSIKAAAIAQELDLDETKSYLGHTAQSINRAMSRFNDQPVEKKEVELAPDGKVKLIEPCGFKLRADARCEERKLQKEKKDIARREKELMEK